MYALTHALVGLLRFYPGNKINVDSTTLYQTLEKVKEIYPSVLKPINSTEDLNQGLLSMIELGVLKRLNSKGYILKKGRLIEFYNKEVTPKLSKEGIEEEIVAEAAGKLFELLTGKKYMLDSVVIVIKALFSGMDVKIGDYIFRYVPENDELCIVGQTSIGEEVLLTTQTITISDFFRMIHQDMTEEEVTSLVCNLALTQANK